MIIDKTIEIKISNINMKHYKNIGYENIKKKDVITVKISELMRNSGVEVRIKCDICDKEKIMCYGKYMDSFLNGNLYTCQKCKNYKSKKTCLKKYGVENISQIQEVKDKKIQKSLDKYGCINVFQSEEVKEKLKKTCLDKYGFEHPLQNIELLEKSKQTCFNNYGVYYPAQTEGYKEKSEITYLKNFGEKHYTQTEDYRKKVNETNLEKYNSMWYMQSKDFQEKTKITNIKKYGVEHNMQNEEIHNKTQIKGFKAKNHDKMNLFYRGTYEKHFLDYCYENKISLEKGKRISYFKDINRYYFSDYYLPNKNLIIEIKSLYYYNKYYELNMIKKESAINNGFNFIFIIDKKYDEFLSLINN